MRNIVLFVFVASFSIGLLSCTEKPSIEHLYNQIKENQHLTIHSCDPYASYETKFGALQNNVWNAHSAGNYPWEQCIGEIHQNGLDQHGWIWKWPKNGKTVYAQPQITLGYSPWLNHDSYTSDFPISIDDLNNLVIEYDVEMFFEGELNLTSTLWLTDSDTISTRVDKNSIQAEVMVWTYSTDGFYANPAGKKVNEVLISGILWEVWLNKDWHDTSGINDNNWTYLAFRSKENTTSVSFDMAEMLKFSVQNGYLKTNLYIADIQLGNEVMSGAGATWLKNYQVRR